LLRRQDRSVDNRKDRFSVKPSAGNEEDRAGWRDGHCFDKSGADPEVVVQA
jgi:hypothetical protein